MKDEELKLILSNHKHWLNRDVDDWISMKANLRGADLIGANLFGANLKFADLSYANLYGADLACANLGFSDLQHANLRCADLRWATLCEANLSNADLTSANLACTILQHADLSYTNLYNANLRCANLYEADLNNAERNLIEYCRGRMLSENIIGYKKCVDNVIVTLEIPRGAIVFSINGNKCRTNKAKVIAIDGANRAISEYKYMSYYVGDEFNIYDFNCEYNNDCAEGIHFYMSKKEAKNA